jgi:hypothetical protein
MKPLLNFCENCGSKIKEITNFCIQCGNPFLSNFDKFDQSSSSAGLENKDIFKIGDFRDYFEYLINIPSNTEIYLFITNTSILVEQLGEEEALLIRSNILNRCGIKDNNCYLFFDFAKDFESEFVEWKYHVQLLNDNENILKDRLGKIFSGFIIIGDNSVIPQAIFDDLTDTDANIESDSVYSTLSLHDPWLDQSALEFSRQVSRIPIGNSFLFEDIKRYWQNRDSIKLEDISTDLPFALSAKCWEDASQQVLNEIGSGIVKTSPDLDHTTLMSVWNIHAPWHYFNVHGSSEEADWYGDYLGEYPIAFNPSLAKEIKVLNVIGVEACYGAKFIGLDSESSILIAALKHLTVSFLGSSKIAFGPSTPPNSLADVMIRDYLSGMRSGLTAGESHKLAQKALISALNDSTGDSSLIIKTLLSFNLFGDPTVRLINSNRSNSINLDPLKVEIIDPLQLVRNAVDSSMGELQEKLQNALSNLYPDINGINPLISKYQTRYGEKYRWHWKTLNSGIIRHYIALTDNKGNISDILESK